MPVEQLTNQQGGLGTILGMVGGYLAGNPQRKAAKAQQEFENKRVTANDKIKAKELQSNIDEHTAKTNQITTDATRDALQQNLYDKYAPQLSTVPKGVDPKQWVNRIRGQAIELTDPGLRGRFDAEAQRVLAASAPKLSQVEHGLSQPVLSGKQAWTPEQIVKHYSVDAVLKVLNSDMPPEQQKAAIDALQKMGSAALKAAPKAPAQMTPYQQQELGLRREQLGIDRQRVGIEAARGGRGGDTPSLEERVREFNLEHPGVDPKVQQIINGAGSLDPATRTKSVLTSKAFQGLNPTQQSQVLDGIKRELPSPPSSGGLNIGP